MKKSILTHPLGFARALTRLLWLTAGLLLTPSFYLLLYRLHRLKKADAKRRGA